MKVITINESTRNHIHLINAAVDQWRQRLRKLIIMNLLISLALCAAVWMLVLHWEAKAKKDKEKMRIRTNNLIAALAEVSPESIWGKAIHKVLEELTADKLAQLIRSLKSQNRDCPDTMRSILGTSYLAIINFDETKIVISTQLGYPVAVLS